MSAERYAMNLIRLHSAGGVMQGDVLVGVGRGHGRCSILQDMVQGRGKEECMNHCRLGTGSLERIGRVNHLCLGGAVVST